MASSSSSSLNNSCFQCLKSFTYSLFNGWKLRNGEFSKLCHDCHYLYKTGQFCVAFHSNENGWRDCKFCKKLIHCGCSVTLSDYFLHDLGGITCVDCWKINLHKALDRSDAESFPKTLILPANPIGTEPEDLKMQSIFPDRVVHFLFKKKLSASDAIRIQGSIIIPKEHAEAYFPHIRVSQGVQLEILDTDGKDWEFYFHCKRKGNAKVYVLKRLEDYMTSNDLKVGDTVAFYQRESDGKMILSLNKS